MKKKKRIVTLKQSWFSDRNAVIIARGERFKIYQVTISSIQ